VCVGRREWEAIDETSTCSGIQCSEWIECQGKTARSHASSPSLERSGVEYVVRERERAVSCMAKSASNTEEHRPRTGPIRPVPSRENETQKEKRTQKRKNAGEGTELKEVSTVG
jgi:hypothetical protein